MSAKRFLVDDLSPDLDVLLDWLKEHGYPVDRLTSVTITLSVERPRIQITCTGEMGEVVPRV